MKRILVLTVVSALVLAGFYARDVWEMLYLDSRVAPIMQEFNPTANRMAELLSQNTGEIVSIDFYGVDEEEVRNRKQRYMMQLEKLGVSFPPEKTRVVLTSYPGGRQHIVGIRPVTSAKLEASDEGKIRSNQELIEKINLLDEEWKTLEKKTRQFGLSCWGTEEGKKLCRQFITLIEQHQTVADVVKRAQRARLSIRVDDDWDTSIYSVEISPTASPEKILNYLNNTVKEREEYNDNERVARGLHLMCKTSQPAECAAIIKTAQLNVTLQQLFKEAHARGIGIHIDDEFRFGAGWMTIDGRASADRIVRFLNTGK